MGKLACFYFLTVLAADNFLPFVLGAFYPGYRHKTEALSVLGCRESPVRRIYNAWCIVSGLVFCFAGYAIFDVRRSGMSLAVFVLMVLYGIGCEVISGIFPLHREREARDLWTKIHGAGSAIGFTALLFVPLFLGLWSVRERPLPSAVSFVCFGAAFLCFSFFIMGEKDKFRNTVLCYGGLWQRAVLLLCCVPLAFSSVYLYQS